MAGCFHNVGVKLVQLGCIGTVDVTIALSPNPIDLFTENTIVFREPGNMVYYVDKIHRSGMNSSRHGKQSLGTKRIHTSVRIRDYRRIVKPLYKVIGLFVGRVILTGYFASPKHWRNILANILHPAADFDSFRHKT
jgi:uncharacterized protein YkwD